MILRELNLQEAEAAVQESIIREIIAKAFWAWYAMNSTRRLTTIRIWIFRKSFLVSDLRPVFELLFGPPPVATP
jgi:hypothetical protein